MQGLVPEGLRWTKGIDPSVIANAHRNCKESASVFLNEMDDFKANPDMSFIDFKALKEDEKFMEDHKVKIHLPMGYYTSKCYTNS